jgi:hypothetical protein
MRSVYLSMFAAVTALLMSSCCASKHPVVRDVAQADWPRVSDHCKAVNKAPFDSNKFATRLPNDDIYLVRNLTAQRHADSKVTWHADLNVETSSSCPCEGVDILEVEGEYVVGQQYAGDCTGTFGGTMTWLRVRSDKARIKSTLAPVVAPK